MKIKIFLIVKLINLTIKKLAFKSKNKKKFNKMPIYAKKY